MEMSGVKTPTVKQSAKVQRCAKMYSPKEHGKKKKYIPVKKIALNMALKRPGKLAKTADFGKLGIIRGANK